MVVSLSSSAPVDWSRTCAYSAGMYGNVFINLKGREAQGIVAELEYAALCGEIRERLLRLEDPDTGERVVEAVHHRDEVYSGPFVADAPDLLIHWKDYAYPPDRQDLPGTGRLHSPRAVAEGSQDHRRRPEPAVPAMTAIPNDLDGRLRPDMFDDGYFSANPPRSTLATAPRKSRRRKSAPTPPEDDTILQERLRSLGYIE